MSEIAVMRPLKDGSGYSLCKAPEDRVGLKKCNHVPNSVTFNVEIKKINDKVSEIVVGQNFIDLTVGDKEAVIERFIDSMAPVPSDVATRIVDSLAKLQ